MKKETNKVWVFMSKSGHVLCYRQPSETPVTSVPLFVPPYTLRSTAHAKGLTLFKETKDALLSTGVKEMWNNWSAFEDMKVAPKQIDLESVV